MPDVDSAFNVIHLFHKEAMHGSSGRVDKGLDGVDAISFPSKGLSNMKV